MERERPDYLPPIQRARWEFPWLGLWAVLLLGMAGAGIWLHLRTGDAWNARFNGEPEPSRPTIVAQPHMPEPSAEREEVIAAIRARRERADREAQQGRADVRCIGGVAFRRIPGGWENIPGQPCP